MDDNFKKKIVSDFGLGLIESREQERLIEKIGNLLFESVVERAIHSMDESTIQEFDSLVSGENQDYRQIVAFLQKRVEGFNEIVSDELARLKRATSGIFA